MPVQRLYLTAVLGLALAGLVTFTVARGHGSSANRPLSARQQVALEAAALKRVQLPGHFVRTDGGGCTTARCFVVDRSSSQVAASMPGLLRAAGFDAPGQLRKAEPLAALRRAHWSTATNDPVVMACRMAYAGAHTPLAECQDAGRLGQTLVNVLIRPYQPCNNQTCTEPGKTEVVEWSIAFSPGA